MSKNLINGIIAIGVGVAIWLFHVPEGLTPKVWTLFAIFVATIVGFILQPLPMGAVAVISITFTALTGILKLPEALAGFSNSTIWLIVAAFSFARGFIKTGLGRRIAFKFMTLWGGSTLFLGYSMVASDFVMSIATPSNTARAGGVIFPIARSLCVAYDSMPGVTARRFGAYLMQTVYQGNTITSAMFMTAMAGNPLCVELARKMLGINIGWLDWAMAAIVPGLVSLIVIPYVIYLVYPPEIKKTPEAKRMAAQALTDMGPMSSLEKMVVMVFLVTVTLWISAGLKQVLPWLPVIDATVVALMGVGVMLVTGVLEWKDVIEEGGAWDSLVWMGSTVALADALGKLGFISWFTNVVSGGLSGFAWVPALLILVVVYMYSHYGFASLTAHITAMYAAFVAVATAAGAPPVLSALAFAFLSNLCMSLTHYAAGPAPIFFNAGYVSQGAWWQLGFLTSIINLVIWMGLGAFWWKVLGLW